LDETLRPITADEMVRVEELFNRDPLDLAQDQEARAFLVDYHRRQREVIRAAEAAGKRVTKKTSLNATPSDEPQAGDLF